MLDFAKRIGRMIAGAPEPLDALAAADYVAVTDDNSTMAFQGNKTVVDAFTDPRSVSPKAAMALIDAAVANRPDADALREALAIRFIKQRGINMYGTTLHDAISGEKGHPDTNPTTLYVSPYPRPTAGSIVMTSYRDASNQAHVLLVKNWKDPLDHSKGIEEDWRFPGGYLNARDPLSPADNKDGHQHDHNLDSAAKREVEEETGLKLNDKQLKQLFVRSDCGLKEKSPTHAIDAFYVADLGQLPIAPPVRAGDDVATVRWVSLRDVVRHSGSPSFPEAHNHASSATSQFIIQTDGAKTPFRAAHAELMDKGIAYLNSAHSITKPDDMPEGLAESFATDNPQALHIHLHLNRDKSSWQQRVQASKAVDTPQRTVH